MPDPSSRAASARRERMEQIALFRYQLIREAADETVTSRQRGPMVRALAGQVHPGPFGGTVRVSKDTIDRWIRLWRRGGFDALKPQGRTQGPVTAPQLLSLAGTLKRERPARTAAQVRRIMIDTLGDAPSESTLLRHFRTLEIATGTREVFGRFEADYPNELWVGDGLHGPRIAGRKTYLFAFLDDHSRLVVAARWAFAEDSVRLTAALRPALESRGIPGTVYVDNGSAFADESLARTCARLGIRLTHSTPYRPQGRGKIERFFNTVTSQFLTEITVQASSGEIVDAGPVGSVIASLDELNGLFTSWVEMVYHRAVHSTTGQSPLARWDAGWAVRRPDRRDPAVIAEAFRWSAMRTVTKSATSAAWNGTGVRVQAWGLTNDVEHSILVRAVNEAGPGAASDPADGTPELRPVYDGGVGPEIPTTPPGTGTLLVDGVPQEVVITVDGDTTTMTGDGFTLTLTAFDGDGNSFAVDAQGRLIVTEDGSVRVSGSGFLPGSIVDVWLFSTPQLLGELLVDSGGRFAATLPLPGDIALGEHTIQLNGVAAGGEVRSLTTGIVVLATPVAALSATGSAGSQSAALGMVAMLLLGTMLLIVGRRRASAQR